jgi:hypothetical protein
MMEAATSRSQMTSIARPKPSSLRHSKETRWTGSFSRLLVATTPVVAHTFCRTRTICPCSGTGGAWWTVDNLI